MMSTIFEEVSDMNVTQEVTGLDVTDSFISDNVTMLTLDDLFITCDPEVDEDFSRYDNDMGDVPVPHELLTPPTKKAPTEPPPLIGKKRVFVQIKSRCLDWDY